MLALVGYLVRSLEGADRQQRELVAELHERQEFAATLLQSMNEAVMVLDANYRVIDVNRRWRELTGHRAEDAARHPAGVTAADRHRRLAVRRVDGTDVPVLATMAPVPDANGAPRAYVATYVDIADRKRAEEAISEHAAELERSNDQLREANPRLEQALAFKNDLTSMLTHDVAQPISSIASLSELLSADWADLPEDIRLELATKIDKNTNRLIKMMNDLQLLFRLDTGSVTARRTPVPVLRGRARAVAADADGDVEIAVAEDVVRAGRPRSPHRGRAEPAEATRWRTARGRCRSGPTGRPTPSCWWCRTAAQGIPDGAAAEPVRPVHARRRAGPVHRAAPGGGERRHGPVRARRAAGRPADRHTRVGGGAGVTSSGAVR